MGFRPLHFCFLDRHALHAIVIRAGVFAFDFNGILFSCVVDSSVEERVVAVATGRSHRLKVLPTVLGCVIAAIWSKCVYGRG